MKVSPDWTDFSRCLVWQHTTVLFWVNMINLLHDRWAIHFWLFVVFPKTWFLNVGTAVCWNLTYPSTWVNFANTFTHCLFSVTDTILPQNNVRVKTHTFFSGLVKSNSCSHLFLTWLLQLPVNWYQSVCLVLPAAGSKCSSPASDWFQEKGITSDPS